MPGLSGSDDEDVAQEEEEEDVEDDAGGEDEHGEPLYRMTAERLGDLVKKMLRPDGSGLKLASGRQRRPITFDPQQYTPEHRRVRLQRSIMQWRSQDGLRDLCAEPRQWVQEAGVDMSGQDPGDIVPEVDESRSSPRSSDQDSDACSPPHAADPSSSVLDEALARCQAQLREAVTTGTWDVVTGLSEEMARLRLQGADSSRAPERCECFRCEHRPRSERAYYVFRDPPAGKTRFLFHTSGVIPDVKVYARIEKGVWQDFDGSDIGVLNFSDTLLFTHELLQQFWDQSCASRTTHKGWIRGVIDGWKRNVQASGSGCEDGDDVRAQVMGILSSPSLPDRIYEALYDYVGLLDIDYASLFTCQCPRDTSREAIVGVYDNCCKWYVPAWLPERQREQRQTERARARATERARESVR